MEEEEDNLTVLVPPPACKGSPSSGVVTTSSPYDASIVGLGSTTKERLVNILKEKDRTIAKLQARVSELEAELFNNKTTSQDALVSNSNASLSTSSPKSYIHNHLGSVCSSTVKLVGADKQSTAQAVDTGLSLRRGGACSDDTEHRMEPIHVTDTQRIISRYNDLKKGSKGKKHLQFDATKKLLKPSLIIEFAEDNPSFWRKIDALDENVESLRAHLQHLVTVARSYCNIGNSFCEHGRELASALLHLHGEDWLKRLGLVAHILVHFGETLDEIQNYVEAFLLSLENTFTAPMEEFVKREVKNIRKMKNVVHRTSVEYETGLSNLLSLKNNCDELAAEARLSEVATMKKRFELARFDLVHHLNQLETKKKFQLVERVCNALYAFLGLFHQCHTEVARIEPSMRDMQYALHFARKDFARSNGIWDAKRVNLELELNRKFLCVWGGSDDVSLHLNNLDADLAFHRSSTGNDAMISGTSLGVVHQLSQKPENINRSVSLSAKATVDESVSHNVLSSTTSETNSNTGPPESVPVVYSGYLWKKNSRVRSSSRRKNWKRRWFSVHGGTLSYEKYSLPPGSSILVRNLELCTVCACEAPSDYRFSFEIIGPTQRTCRLQAESEVSRQAWMEAIKLEIERVLCLELKNNHSSSSFNQSPPTPVQKYSTPAIFDMEVAAALQRLTRVNNTCADCGAPDPKWASINLGILICRECSGCHRSMGVKVSKVRSLNLDEWHLSLVQLMDKIGNERLNHVLEACCQEGIKPAPDSERTPREEFIQCKYVSKDFMNKPLVSSPDAEAQSRALYNASFVGDVEAALAAILYGGDVAWANPEEGMATSSHQAVIGQNLLLLELLYLNGAHMDAENEADESPLDIALCMGDQAIISFLALRLDPESTKLVDLFCPTTDHAEIDIS